MNENYIKKNLMILGAGVFQVPAIEKAKDMGIRVIVCSYNPKDPGMNLADKAYKVSTLNKEKVLEICKNENIDGIMTIASEAATPTVSYVAEKLNLVGYNYESVIKILNKYKFRKFLRKNNIKTPNFGEAENQEQAINIFKKINQNSIMKPLESSGSRGVFLITKKRDIKKYFEISKNQSFNKKSVIIEKFISGLEVGGECLIWNGKLVFFQITNKYKNKYFVPIGHILPSKLSSYIKDKIKKSIKKAIDALNLNSGALNFDVIVNKKDKPEIIELGARLGGNCLPILMHKQTGIDTIKECIRITLGMSPNLNFNYSKKSFGVKIIGSMKNGKIIKITEGKKIQNEFNNIYELKYDYNIGDRISKFNQGNHRIGHVIFSTNSIKKSEIFLKKLDKIINLKIY